MKVRSQADPRIPVYAPSGPGLTKQSFKAECDINQIMKRYQSSGLISHVTRIAPMYGVVPALDFQTAMETVALGHEMFDGLPSGIRKRFENDPRKFLEFVQDTNNIEEARKLGLLPKEAPPRDAAGASGGAQGSEAIPTPAESAAGAQAAAQAASGTVAT